MKIRKADGSVHDVAETYVLCDGETMMIEMTMFDSGRMVHGGRGNPAGQRPGFLYADSDIDMAVKETVYKEYADAIEQRWRSDRWQGGPSKPAPSAPMTSGGGDAAAAHEQYRAGIENRWRR
jgi:hypothetical protein